jgi:hypothetical protein
MPAWFRKSVFGEAKVYAKRLKEHQMRNLSISNIATVGHGEAKMEGPILTK